MRVSVRERAFEHLSKGLKAPAPAAAAGRRLPSRGSAARRPGDRPDRHWQRSDDSHESVSNVVQIFTKKIIQMKTV
jgi:hypothetical protein